jgi:hypothetical protein
LDLNKVTIEFDSRTGQYGGVFVVATLLLLLLLLLLEHHTEMAVGQFGDFGVGQFPGSELARVVEGGIVLVEQQIRPRLTIVGSLETPVAEEIV